MRDSLNSFIYCDYTVILESRLPPDRSLRAQMESVIIDYQQSAHSTIGKISSQVEACVAADETFFDQVILVMLDLPSGYIFVEEITENCQYETWQPRVAIALKPLSLKVKYLVSDRAKAIVKLALKDLGTHSIADLFHVLYDLNRSIAWELNYLGSQLQKQLKMSQEKRAQPELIAQIKTNQRILYQFPKFKLQIMYQAKIISCN